MLVPSTARSVEVLHETRLPLIALERHAARIDPGLLERARRELLRGTRNDDDAGSFRSGYLLGVQAHAGTHPACLALARTLHARMLADSEREHGL